MEVVQTRLVDSYIAMGGSDVLCSFPWRGRLT